MKREKYGPRDAARHLSVNVRTIQRWLSGASKVPNWMGLITSESASAPRKID